MVPEADDPERVGEAILVAARHAAGRFLLPASRLAVPPASPRGEGTDRREPARSRTALSPEGPSRRQRSPDNRPPSGSRRPRRSPARGRRSVRAARSSLRRGRPAPVSSPEPRDPCCHWPQTSEPPLPWERPRLPEPPWPLKRLDPLRRSPLRLGCRAPARRSRRPHLRARRRRCLSQRTCLSQRRSYRPRWQKARRWRSSPRTTPRRPRPAAEDPRLGLWRRTPRRKGKPPRGLPSTREPPAIGALHNEAAERSERRPSSPHQRSPHDGLRSPLEFRSIVLDTRDASPQRGWLSRCRRAGGHVSSSGVRR